MKFTVIAILVLVTTACGDKSAQQRGDQQRGDQQRGDQQRGDQQRGDQQGDNTGKRALVEGNAAIAKRAPAGQPQGGIEYAVSKEALSGKATQQEIYATPLPELTKISDLLTGHGPGYQAAISSHLYSPLTIYQPRFASPTYEVSAPVPSQLAYSEHKVYQIPQNSVINQETEKLQDKQSFKQYQPAQQQVLLHQPEQQQVLLHQPAQQQVLLHQQPIVSRQQQPLNAAPQGQPQYHVINQLFSRQQVPQNAQPLVQYQQIPYQQQATVTPDDPIFVRGIQLQPLQLHYQHIRYPNVQKQVQQVQQVQQQPQYNQQQPLLLQTFQPVAGPQTRPVYQQVQQYQHTQLPVSYTAQPSVTYTKQNDLNQQQNLRELKSVALPQQSQRQQGAVSYASLSLGPSSSLFHGVPFIPLQQQQFQQAPAQIQYQTPQSNPNLITKNVQRTLSKPELLQVTYSKPQTNQHQLNRQHLNQQQQNQQQQLNQQYLNQQQQLTLQHLNQQQQLNQQHLTPVLYSNLPSVAHTAASQNPSTTKLIPSQYFGKYAESIFGNFNN